MLVKKSKMSTKCLNRFGEAAMQVATSTDVKKHVRNFGKFVAIFFERQQLWQAGFLKVERLSVK